MINESRIQTQADLSRYESSEEQPSDSDLPKYPRPVKRPRNDTRSIKNRSKTQERELARSYRLAGFANAKRVPGSGALAGLPADVDPGQWFLCEAKETRAGRLTINPEWIAKITSQAKQMGRPWWALHAWVADSTKPYNKVVVLDHDHFFELIARLKACEGCAE